MLDASREADAVDMTARPGSFNLNVLIALLSAGVTVLGLMWAGDATLAIGVPLMPEQILSAVLALALGVLYLGRSDAFVSSFSIASPPRSS